VERAMQTTNRLSAQAWSSGAVWAERITEEAFCQREEVGLKVISPLGIQARQRGS